MHWHQPTTLALQCCFPFSRVSPSSAVHLCHFLNTRGVSLLLQVDVDHVYNGCTALHFASRHHK